MKKNWRGHSITWGKRLVIVVLIMAAALYGVFSLAQRSKEPLRKGLEDYLSNASDQRGEITDLATARLVPDVAFDMRGVNIRDKADGDKVYVHADIIRVAVPLWRMLTGFVQYYALQVVNLETATGFFLPEKLSVSFGGISDPDPEKSSPQFLVEGTYNDLPLLATMEMARRSTGKGPLYSFGNKALVTFKLGETEGEGFVTRHFASVSLESIELRSHGIKALLTAEDLHKEPLDIKLKGSIEGIDINGDLTKSGEDILLRLNPVTEPTAAQAETLQKFVNAISGDLGLSGDTKKLRVEIAGATTNTPEQETPEDSKTK